MLDNNFHNKLMKDIEQLSKTLKSASLQATEAINGIDDQQMKAFLSAKMAQATAGKLDIETFLKELKDAQTARNNKQ